MSYPPPPGLKSSTKPPPANLPARPPPSVVGGSFRTDNAATKPAFAAFAPRAVASNTPARTSSPAHYAAQPVASYSAPPAYTQPMQDSYGSQSYVQYYQGSTAPQIRNPFVPTTNQSAPTTYGAPANYDPDYEAQIQQWQSAYMSKDDKPGVFKSVTTTPGPAASASTPTAQTEGQKTVKRTGGGTSWTDSSLLEWDPAHFRLFVGNLAGEVTDESLYKAFSKYHSVQKARVIRDKRTTKSKGYGFVSFSDGDDYFLAAKEMNGKYIGSHPVTITKAKTEVRPSTIKHHDKNKKNRGGAGGHDKVEHGGINKKIPKTKGGLKVLG